jgi:hypothetical protein
MVSHWSSLIIIDPHPNTLSRLESKSPSIQLAVEPLLRQFLHRLRHLCFPGPCKTVQGSFNTSKSLSNRSVHFQDLFWRKDRMNLMNR